MRQAKNVDLLPSYNNIVYMDGPAKFTTDGIAVSNDLLKTDKVVIATGAASAIPPIPGIDGVDILTSTEALALEQLPASLMVIAGGYIGCEHVQMFALARVKISIGCRNRLLPEAEPEIGKVLTGYFQNEGITVRDGLSYRQIRKSERGIALSVTVDGAVESIEAEALLVATGRRPNTQGLNLEQAGV